MSLPVTLKETVLYLMNNLWQIIGPDSFNGAMNMAVDAAIMRDIMENNGPNIIRFYTWNPPCVTLGRFQKLDGINLEACKARGIDIVQRPTGGRAIFHNDEITFSIILRSDSLGVQCTNVMESYRVLGKSIANALRKIGLKAELVDHNNNDRIISTTGNPACFAAKARCDIMVNNKKIIGSAQSRKNNIILQQNSLPISVDYELWKEVFHGSNADMVKESGATELSVELNGKIDYAGIMHSIEKAFSKDLSIEFESAKLSDSILKMARDMEDKYEII